MSARPFKAGAARAGLTLDDAERCEVRRAIPRGQGVSYNAEFFQVR